jgi:microcin C transport system permease protein
MSATASSRIQTDTSGGGAGTYRGARGLPKELIERIEKMYGFDKPMHERFFLMMKNYLVFDFGESFFRNRRVVDLVIEKMPVSISLGLWTTLLVYLVSDPARHRQGGARRLALRPIDLQHPDRAERNPGLPVRPAAGRAAGRRQLCEVVSPARPGVRELGAARAGRQGARLFLAHGAADRAMTIGGFATLTFLTKNSFLEEINKQYVLTARAKGLVERRVLYGHVFRNAMLIRSRACRRPSSACSSPARC